jgi:hypothetical protein
MVTNASDRSAEIARNKAFNEAVERSANSLGVAREVKRDHATGEVTVTQDHAEGTKVPIRVVCEYSEPLIERNGVKVYLLLQVANDGRIIPKYRYFDCENSKEDSQ